MKKEQIHFKRMLAGGLAAFTLANFPVAAHATDFSKSHSSELSNSVNEQTVTGDIDLSDMFIEGDRSYSYDTASGIVSSLVDLQKEVQNQNADIVYLLGTNGIVPQEDWMTENMIVYRNIMNQPADFVTLFSSGQSMTVYEDNYKASLYSCLFSNDNSRGFLDLSIEDEQGNRMVLSAQKAKHSNYVRFYNREDEGETYFSADLSEEDFASFVTSFKNAFLQKLNVDEVLALPVFQVLKEDSNYQDFLSRYHELQKEREIVKELGQNITSDMNVTDLFMMRNGYDKSEDVDSVLTRVEDMAGNMKESNVAIASALGTNGVTPTDVLENSIYYFQPAGQLFDSVSLGTAHQGLYIKASDYSAFLHAYSYLPSAKTDWENGLSLSLYEDDKNLFTIWITKDFNDQNYISMSGENVSELPMTQISSEESEQFIKDLKASFLHKENMNQILAKPVFTCLEDNSSYQEWIHTNFADEETPEYFESNSDAEQYTKTISKN